MNRFASHSLSLFLFGALAAGCNFEPAEVHSVSNECTSDTDCPDGRCEDGTGMCVSVPDEPLEVGLELTPATDLFGARPPTMTFGPMEVRGPTRWPKGMQLPELILVVGNVRAKTEKGDAGRAIPAELSFERPSAFPGGTPTRFVASTASEPMSTPAGRADYRVRVVAETRYDITVRPTGDAVPRFPPLRFEDVSVPGGGDVVRLNVTYGPADRGLGAPATLETLQARVVSGNAAEGRIPEDGLRVRAVDPSSGRVVSSTAVTGARGDPGGFTIHLAPKADDYVLRITAGEERPLFPTITADPSYFASPEIERPDILVPRLGPVRYEGFVETQSMEPVTDAVVTFRSEDVFDDETRITGSFRRTATTDPVEDGDADTRPGRFGLDLLPGEYEVTVTASDAQGELGVIAERLQIHQRDTAVRGQVLQLPRRTRFAGEVRTSGGSPIEGANVLGRALGREPGGAVPAAARYNRDSTAVTDAMGQFDLPLDVGTYDIVIKPAATAGFPWGMQPELTIGRSERNFGNNFAIEAPMPLRGVLRTHDGSPMAGAEIEAYALVEVEGSGGETLERAVHVGRTMTNDDGSYQLLIPPRVR